MESINFKDMIPKKGGAYLGKNYDPNYKKPSTAPAPEQETQQSSQPSQPTKIVSVNSKIREINKPKISSPTLFSTNHSNFEQTILTLPHYENNYINFAENPYQDLTRVDILYQDLMPEPLYPEKVVSVAERISLKNYMANNIMSLLDDKTPITIIGKATRDAIEEINSNKNKSVNKLFKKIKSIKLNPQIYDDTSSHSPFNNLAKNFFIYETCYPIIIDGSSIKCSEHAHNINLRMYKVPLTIEPATTGTTGATTGTTGATTGGSIDSSNASVGLKDDGHLKCELEYYKTTKQYIESKECPNFVLHYATSDIFYDKEIKFNDANNIINHKPAGTNITTVAKSANDLIYKQKIEVINYFIEYYKSFKDKVSDDNKIKINNFIKKAEQKINDFDALYYNIDNLGISSGEKEYKKEEVVNKVIIFIKAVINVIDDDFYKWLKKNKTEIKDDKSISFKLDIKGEKYDIKTSEKELDNFLIVSIDEAPNNSLTGWSKPESVLVSGVAKMTVSGYHTDEEKKSVLFQLMYLLYIFCVKRIYIPNININNLFVKTTKDDGKLFVYNIDGVEYYVPNRGTILLFDSRYNTVNDDVKPNDVDDAGKKIEEKNNISFGQESIVDIYDNFVKLINCEQVKNALSCDTYTKIITGITSITKTGDILKDLRLFIATIFGSYVNNRCGTYLSMNEYREMNSTINSLYDYRPGELVLLSVDNDSAYKIVQIITTELNKDSVEVITKDVNGKTSIAEYPITELYAIKDNSFIPQTKDKYFRVEENIIERYNIKSQ